MYMKKIFLLCAVALTLIFTSCSQHVTQFGQAVYFLDLRPLTNDGFFITESNSVGFDYQSLGVMTLYEFSGEDKTYVVSQEEIKKDFRDELYLQSTIKKMNKHWREANGLSALTQLVNTAKEIGANGIINLSIKYHYSTSEENKAMRYLIYVEVSGMIIKR